MMRIILGLLLLPVLSACDQDAVDPLPASGSFSLEASSGDWAISKWSGGFVVTERVGNVFVIEGRSLTGAEQWRFPLQLGESGGYVAIDQAGNIFARTSAGLLSLTSAGTLRWRTPLAGNGALALSSNGTLYTASDAGATPAYIAVDGTTGKQIWSVAGTRISGAIVLDESRHSVYFVAGGGATALDMQTGNVRWKTFTEAYGRGNAAVSFDGTLYVTYDSDFLRTVHAISSDGVVKWRMSIAPDPGGIDPLIDQNGNVYVSSGAGYGGLQNRLISLSPSGAINWEYDLSFAVGGRRVHSQGVVDDDGTVYFIGRTAGGENSELLGVRNGQLVLEKPVSSLREDGSPLMDNAGRIYYADGGQMQFFTGSGYPQDGWSQQGAKPERTFRSTPRFLSD